MYLHLLALVCAEYTLKPYAFKKGFPNWVKKLGIKERFFYQNDLVRYSKQF